MTQRPVVCHITTVHTVKDTRIYHKECRALAEAGYKVYLVAVNANTTESDYPNVEIINVPVPFSSKLQRIIKAPRMARRVAESLEAEVYHFHDPEFLLQARKMAQNGLKVIYDAHEDVPKQVKNKAWIPRPFRSLVSKVIAQIENRCIQSFSAVVTVVDSIENRMSMYNENVVQVRNYPSLSELPSPASWDQKKQQACYVGDLTKIRGTREMVDAIGIAQKDFVLAGKFANESLQHDVEASPGWERTNYLGFINRSAVKDVYADSKIGLVTLHPTPSYVDAIPVKMLEYMAAGVPFVGSDFGFIRTVVEKHKCGILVDPLNPTEIAKAINTLMSDDHMAKAMGEKGRRAVEQFYDWRDQSVKLVSLYHNILGHAGAA